MTNILNDILEDAKIAYKESIIISNEALEERLLSIIGNTKSLLNELQKTNKNYAPQIKNETEMELNAIEKVKKRVPLWLTRPHQKNYKILTTYMSLSENDNYSVLLPLLEKNSGLDSREFTSHYNQMKSFAEKAHGKIFEEEGKQVKLWEPVANFIVNLFQNNTNTQEPTGLIMNKNKAAEIINKSLLTNELNPKNGGNIKFANKNQAKNVYWVNVHLNKLSEQLHFILNDEEKREFIHLTIPPNTLDTSLFVVREDTTNGLDKIDIELSSDTLTYLQDIKSNSTKFDFTPYVSGVYKY